MVSIRLRPPVLSISSAMPYRCFLPLPEPTDLANTYAMAHGAIQCSEFVRPSMGWSLDMSGWIVFSSSPGWIQCMCPSMQHGLDLKSPWMSMDLGHRFPLGWTLPGYPSMIQLDGLWAMDEFETLARSCLATSSLHPDVPRWRRNIIPVYST
jgi:hypothetical protein